MRIFSPPGGPGDSGSGPYWHGSRHRYGLVHALFSDVCYTISSCFYVFCCCWLVEDCLVGRRSFPGRPFGSPEPPPPPPPQVGPPSHGLLGTVFGPPSLQGPPGPLPQPGPVGYPGEPSPPSF